MNLEDQVCSLVLSRRLKKLGVKQESIFYWFKQFQDNEYLIHYIDYIHHETDLKIFINHFPDSYSAFTVAELGEMLPDWTKTCKRMKDDWVCIVHHEHNHVNDHSFEETEANARAKMLIHLIENKIIEVPE